MPPSRPSGLTLIEILTLIAIVAVLGMVVVPNWLGWRERSVAGRVQSDFRKISRALEAYHADWHWYPLNYYNGPQFWVPPQTSQPTVKYWTSLYPSTLASFCFVQLTTPTAYMDKMIYEDPFAAKVYYLQAPYQDVPANSYLYYASIDTSTLSWRKSAGSIWALISIGPDRIFNGGSGGSYIPYDPTNGAISIGDIYLYGPGESYDDAIDNN